MLIILFIQTGKIQALKKTATKGDKKKKKDVAEEIAKLENEIEARHEVELKKLQVCFHNLIAYLTVFTQCQIYFKGISGIKETFQPARRKPNFKK